MIRVINLNGIDFNVEYDYIPEQKQTMTDPHFDSYVDILCCWVDGMDKDADLFDMFNDLFQTIISETVLKDHEEGI